MNLLGKIAGLNAAGTPVEVHIRPTDPGPMGGAAIFVSIRIGGKLHGATYMGDALNKISGKGWEHHLISYLAFIAEKP